MSQNLPDLTGSTERQLLIGNEVRAGILRRAPIVIKSMKALMTTKPGYHEREAALDRAYEALRGKTDAVWWMRHRYDGVADLLTLLKEEADRVDA